MPFSQHDLDEELRRQRESVAAKSAALDELIARDRERARLLAERLRPHLRSEFPDHYKQFAIVPKGEWSGLNPPADFDVLIAIRRQPTSIYEPILAARFESSDQFLTSWLTIGDDLPIPFASNSFDRTRHVPLNDVESLLSEFVRSFLIAATKAGWVLLETHTSFDEAQAAHKKNLEELESTRLSELESNRKAQSAAETRAAWTLFAGVALALACYERVAIWLIESGASRDEWYLAPAVAAAEFFHVRLRG